MSFSNCKSVGYHRPSHFTLHHSNPSVASCYSACFSRGKLCHISFSMLQPCILFFFLLLECANKYLWSGLTNTSCIINAEFSEALANHIRNLMQQWFYTDIFSLARRVSSLGLSEKEQSSVLLTQSTVRCPCRLLQALSSLLTSLGSSTDGELRDCMPMDSGVVNT